jgi:hypothetical protein
MILPDAQSPGALEDVCLRAIEGTPALLCVHQYFDCLRQQGLPLPRSMSKANVLVYLASQLEPDKRLGESAQAGCWNWDHPAFNSSRDFLRNF